MESSYEATKSKIRFLVTMRIRTYVFYILLLELVPKNVRLAIDVEAEDEEEE